MVFDHFLINLANCPFPQKKKKLDLIDAFITRASSAFKLHPGFQEANTLGAGCREGSQNASRWRVTYLKAGAPAESRNPNLQVRLGLRLLCEGLSDQG